MSQHVYANDGKKETALQAAAPRTMQGYTQALATTTIHKVGAAGQADDKKTALLPSDFQAF